MAGSSRKKGFKKDVWGAINVNENWRKRYNKELMQIFGDLYMLSFVWISQLNWIGHVNWTDSKGKVSQVFSKISKEDD